MEGRLRSRAALLAGAAAVALLAWGWMKPADGKVPGWEPVNGQVTAAVASLSAEAHGTGGSKESVAAGSRTNGAAASESADNADKGKAAADSKGEALPGRTSLQGPDASASASADHRIVQRPADSSVATGPIGTDSGAASAAGSQAPAAVSDGSPNSASAAASGLLDINAATASELDALPGIGPAKAEAIVQYREAHGRFRTVSDLKNVKGIGDKLLAKLLPLITAG